MGDSYTVGVLYPGEMGAALARLLVDKGTRVVTTLRGRSQATGRRACEGGAIVLDSLADVVRESDVLLSAVSPDSAIEVAADYCRCAELAPSSALYVDLNSVGPESAKAMQQMLTAAGRSFVGAAVNGLAKNVASAGTLFLSGSRADEIAQFIGTIVRTQVLGSDVGAAKTMKMLLGGLSKGICALFLELASLAERRELLPELMDACARIYPGVGAVVDRMLPTYSRHAGRRVHEMRALEQTLDASGLEPAVIPGIVRLHEQLAEVSWTATDGLAPAEFVRQALTKGLLAADLNKTLSA